ncbi:MAG: hypothetical protein HOV79_07955 [Hamadaea sp.]|nr:hypothetical protein [Hamadaea sp.]
MSKHTTAEPDTTAGIDDLAVGLARAERKPWVTRSTLILGGLVLVTAGFLGGLQVDTADAAAGTGTPAGGRGGSGMQGFPGGGFSGQGLPGGAQGGQTARNATTGTVKLVQGTTVYVELADGTIVTVKVTDSTTVQSSTKIGVKDLKAGASVTVQGQTGSDGSVTAGSITTTK